MRQSDSRLRSPASPGSFIPLRRRFVLFLFAFFGAGREFPPLSKIRRCVVPRTSYVGHLFGFQKAISNIYFTMQLKTRRAVYWKRRARCSRDTEARTMQATEAFTESEQRLGLRLELRNDDDTSR